MSSLVAAKAGNFLAGMTGAPKKQRDELNAAFKFNRNRTKLDEYQGMGKVGKGVVKAAAGTVLMFVPGGQAIGGSLISSGISNVGSGASEIKAAKNSSSLLNFGNDNPIGEITNVVSTGVSTGLGFAGSGGGSANTPENIIDNSPIDQRPVNNIDTSTMAMRDAQENSPSSLLNNTMNAYKGGLVKGLNKGGDASGKIIAKPGNKGIDEQPAKLNGFVIPKNMVTKAKADGLFKMLGIDESKPASLNKSGGADVNVTDGEIYIDREKINMLEKAVGKEKAAMMLNSYAPESDSPVMLKNGGDTFPDVNIKLPTTDYMFSANKTPASLKEFKMKYGPSTEASAETSAENGTVHDVYAKSAYANLMRHSKLGNLLSTGMGVGANLAALIRTGKLKYQDLPNPSFSNPKMAEKTDVPQTVLNEINSGTTSLLRFGKESGMDPAYIANIASNARNKSLAEIGRGVMDVNRQIEMGNTGTFNQYALNRTNLQYQRDRENQLLKNQFADAKGAAMSTHMQNIMDQTTTHLNNKSSILNYAMKNRGEDAYVSWMYDENGKPYSTHAAKYKAPMLLPTSNT